MELNKIYCENCLDTMARMSDDFIDLTVTSPPYDNLRDYKGYEFDFESIAQELYRVTKPGGVVVWVVGDATINGSETLTSFKQAIYFKDVCGFRVHDTMIYERPCVYPGNNRYSQDFEYCFVLSKGSPNTTNIIRDTKSRNAGRPAIKVKKLLKNGKRIDEKGNRVRPNFKERSNIWGYMIGGGISSKDKIAFKHPAIFPEQLAGDHIKSWSNEGDLIYDPFTGSGTTLKMSLLLNRNWIGSEISKEYTEIANSRIEPYLLQTRMF